MNEHKIKAVKKKTCKRGRFIKTKIIHQEDEEVAKNCTIWKKVASEIITGRYPQCNILRDVAEPTSAAKRNVITGNSSSGDY